MNDERLIQALRGLDRPVEPEPAFADALFGHLQQASRPRRSSRAGLLLVAALLAAAVMGTALAVGSGLLDGPRRDDGLTTKVATPPPSSDSSSALRLVRRDGGIVTPIIVPIPEAGKRPSVGPLASTGETLWAGFSYVYQEEAPHLLQIDSLSNAMTEVQLPGGRPNDPVLLAAADGSIWAAASGLLHRIDAATGEARLTGRVDQSPYQIGLDADGLWVSRPFGMTLVDPESGEMLRRIESREDEGEVTPIEPSCTRRRSEACGTTTEAREPSTGSTRYPGRRATPSRSRKTSSTSAAATRGRWSGLMGCRTSWLRGAGRLRS